MRQAVRRRTHPLATMAVPTPSCSTSSPSCHPGTQPTAEKVVPLAVRLFLSRTLMKFNSPIPQSLPKECAKAAKICACNDFEGKRQLIDPLAQSNRSWTARITASTVSFPERSSSTRRASQYSASSKQASCSQPEQVRSRPVECGVADRFESGSGVVIARLDNGSMCSLLPRPSRILTRPQAGPRPVRLVPQESASAAS